MQTQIPLLQSVRVASPCHADWEGMETVEGERVKFCTSCSKNVYNLTAMTRAEAESLLQRHEGRLCVRYYQRNDGTILSKDCSVGVQAVRLSLLRRSVVAAGLFAVLIASMSALDQSQKSRVLTGDISPAITAQPAMSEPHPTQVDGQWTEGEVVTSVPDTPIEPVVVEAPPAGGWVAGGMSRPIVGKLAHNDNRDRAEGEQAIMAQEQKRATSGARSSGAEDVSDEAILKAKTR